MKTTQTTLEYILATNKQIKKLAKKGDYEAAFGLENEMHVRVLRDIASRSLGPGESVETIASNALVTQKLDFQRFTA